MMHAISPANLESLCLQPRAFVERLTFQRCTRLMAILTIGRLNEDRINSHQWTSEGVILRTRWQVED